MVKRTVEELSTYNAPGHHGCTCMRYHGKDETGASKFWVGMSVFLPGGGADYVLEGEMTVTDKDGNEYVIHANESISFPPNEGRYLENKTNLPAKMLVIINYPEA